MPEQDRLSRELSQDELPAEAKETLEEARPVSRKPLGARRRASGSEEKPGTQGRPSDEPAPDARPGFKTPPFDAPTAY
jgi:hypothetical protein